MTERVSTGIEGLDNLIAGGLPRGRSVLVAGEPGTGKTTLCLQFLMEGLRRGESVIYVGIDEKPMHIIQDALGLEWKFQPYLDSGKFQILDVSDYFSVLKPDNKEAGKDLNVMINDLKDFIAKAGATRVAIDPIAPLIFNRQNLPEIDAYMRALVFALEESQAITTLLTSHVPVGTAALSQHGIEEFIVSGIVTLRLIKLTNKYVRTLLVRKMRGSFTELTEYSFDILSGRGVVLRQPI